MIRHGGYFYAFYAAAGCCGAGCNYITGVARAKSLLGPWEKDPRGPALTNGHGWNCPGHGTPVMRNGRYYFLYHGYDAGSTVHTGREGLLQEFSFTREGWVNFLPSTASSRPAWHYTERFGSKLEQGWQWSVFQTNPATVAAKSLTIKATDAPVGGYIGRAGMSGSYAITAKINRKSSGVPGVGAIGDDKNALSVQIAGDSVMVVKVRQGVREVLGGATVPRGAAIWLRMQSVEPGSYAFSYSLDGRSFTPVASRLEGRFLPPWDRAVRAGLLSSGAIASQAVFESVVVE